MPDLRRLTAAFGLSASLVSSLPSLARAQAEAEPGEDAEVEAPVHVSVIQRFSVTRIARWLGSEDLNERLRGIERLGEVGTPAALARLTGYAFERRAQLVGREWLTLARTLAPHASDSKAELVLAMLLNQSPTSSTGPEEAALLELARGAAALALADDGGATALLVLGRALRAVGAPAAAAADALVAHPPGSIAPLLDAPGEPSVELAELLGALADQRAFHALRDWVRGGTTDVRAAAALALTRLGDLETVPLGALWLAQGSPELRRVGLQILLLTHDPRAEPALSALLAEGPTSESDQRRLLEFPSPSLAKPLLGALEQESQSAAWRWTLLGRIGGEAAAQRLARGLGNPRTALAAAHALSRLPGDDAYAALAAQLEAGAVSPIAVRVAAARAELGERFPALAPRIGAWLHSDVPSERAAAAWARSIAGGTAALEQLESGDEVRVLAAASNALGFDERAIDGAARLLASAAPGRVRTALGVGLLTPRGRRVVSTELLWSLVAEAGAARPLALRALAARSDPGMWTAVQSYLDHPDPLLREHVARGLGESERASAVGYLTRRLAFETDETVRRALVMALGSHRGHAVSRWLDRAARLDPSPRVRSAARLALGGVPLADAMRGDDFLWTELRRPGREPAPLARSEAARHEDAAGVLSAAEERAEGAGERSPEGRPEQRTDAGGDPGVDGAAERGASAALLSVAPGLAMPVFADPGGVLVVSGLPESHLGIRLQ